MRTLPRGLETQGVRMFRDLSLKIKLPMYLSAVVVTIIFALSVASYTEVRRAQVGAAEQRLLRLSGQLADLVAQTFETRRGEAADLGRDARLTAFLEEPSSPVRRDEALAALSAVSDTTVLAIELRDRRGGRLLATGDASRIAGEYAPRGEAGGELSPLLSRDGLPVSAATGAIVGPGGNLGTVSVWRPLQLDPEGWRAFADIIGIEGAILVGSPEGAWTDLVALIEPPPIDLNSPGGEAVGTLLDYERGGAGRVYAMAQSLDPAPRYLVVELTAADVLAGVQAFLIRLGILAPIALLIAAGGAWILGRRITGSLHETAAAAEAIAAGETGHRVAVRGADEVGRLAASFNTMAQRVEDSQKALQEMNASLRTMLDQAPLPIIALGLDGGVRMWNRASATTFGWSEEEVLGGPNPLLDPDGAPLDGLPEEGEDVGRECASFHRDGHRIDLFVARAPTYDPSSGIDGHMLVCEDITARKRAEAQLERYAEDLSRSNAELEEFAYVASHDLREPIRMVRSFTQLLADRYGGQLDEDADKYMHFAVDGATRMEALVRDLLEYSRLDGALEVPAPTPADRVLQQALAILAPSIEAAGATVTYDELPTVLVDPAQLVRVFQNLIGNAIKFRGDAPPLVHVSAQDHGDRTVFSVRDNGIGIAEEYHDRIFVIFKRLHGLRDFEGTGIGLTICKKIVERQGGRMWVESTAGEGSTFYFSLPTGAAMVA